jgi:AraC family transcriptional regulator
VTDARPELERALRFISDNLDRPLSIAELARIARLSEFHFQRVFHAALGESVGRFVTRRRLELAALRLCYEPDRSVTEVALMSGYSSTSNFSKAFDAYFGCSPSAVRNPLSHVSGKLGKLASQYGKDFRPADLYALPPGLDLGERKHVAAEWDGMVRFETTPEISFACLACPEGYELSAIEATWSELIARGQQLGVLGEDVDAWGMAFDSPHLTPAAFRRYHACVPCPRSQPLPAPLFAGRLQAGRYAVFEYSGPIEGVEAAYRAVYSCWFAESSLTPDDFTPVDHYVTDWPEQGQIALELWFRVRPRA